MSPRCCLRRVLLGRMLGRADVEVTRVGHDEVRERLREAPALSERARRGQLIAGSVDRSFPNPFAHGSADAPPLAISIRRSGARRGSALARLARRFGLAENARLRFGRPFRLQARIRTSTWWSGGSPASGGPSKTTSRFGAALEDSPSPRRGRRGRRPCSASRSARRPKWKGYVPVWMTATATAHHPRGSMPRRRSAVARHTAAAGERNAEKTPRRNPIRISQVGEPRAGPRPRR